MVAVEIFERLTKLQQVNYVGVEDTSDRLNFQATVVLLLAFCTTTTFKTYILSPVACYLPNTMGASNAQEQYVNNYCWTEGTFAVPLRNFTLQPGVDHTKVYKNNRITYYQWVPFVLGLQALMFYIPRVLWNCLSYSSAGTDVGHLIRSANDAVQEDGDKHANLVQHVCKRLEQMLMRKAAKSSAVPEETKRKSRLLALKYKVEVAARWLSCGNWLIFTYLIVKICCVANAVGQLFLMQKFLGLDNKNFFFGFTVLDSLRRGKDWQQTMVFPRVGCCGVYFRSGAYGNFLFSQCTLPINMINEKIYIFLWFWILGVGTWTLLSFPKWIYRIVSVRRRAKFVKDFLKLSDNYKQIDKRDCSRFVRKFLRHDGAFLLKMIAVNSGEVVCAEIVKNLWEMYIRRTYHCNTPATYLQTTLPTGVRVEKEDISVGRNNIGGDDAGASNRGNNNEDGDGEAATQAKDTLLKRFNSQPGEQQQQPTQRRSPQLKQQLSAPGD